MVVRFMFCFQEKDLLFQISFDVVVKVIKQVRLTQEQDETSQDVLQQEYKEIER